jgi:signal peptidase II
LQTTGGTSLKSSARPPLRRGQALGLIAGLGGLGLAVDQITKALAVHYLDPGVPVALLGDWFQLQLFRNPGAAFSLGERFTVVFAALAVLVLVAALWWAVRRVRRPWWAVLVGLGLAGVAGNLVDRLVRPPGVFQGHVIDFLFVRGFATFNVADICLTTTAGLLIVTVLLGWTDTGVAPTVEPVGESA